MNKIILFRDRPAGIWCATHQDGITVKTPYSSSEKSGDVARAIASANPNSQIGIRSAEFGPATVILYGAVVWMRPGFQAG